MITWFLLSRKLSYLLSGKDTQALIISILLLLAGTFSGASLAYIYNILGNGRQLPAFRIFLNAGISFLPVLLVFFPSFSSRKTFISSIYPVSRYRIASAELAMHSIKPGNILLAAFICTFYLLAKGFHWTDMPGSCCFLVFGLVLSQTILLFLATRKNVLLVCTLLFYPLALFCLYRNLIPQNVAGLLLAALMTGIFMAFYTNEIPSIAASVSTNERSNSHPSRSRLITRTFYKKQIVYLSLSIGLLLKTLLLSGVYKVLIKTGGSVWDNFIFYISFPPLVLFTYLFNNTWGLDHDFSATVILTARNPFKVFCGSYLTLLGPAAAMDLCLSALFVWLSHSDPLALTCYYLTFLIYLTAIGIYFSFVSFRRIHRSFSILTARNNTSMLANIASAFPVSVLILFYHWKLSLYPFFCLLLTTTACLLARIVIRRQHFTGRLTYRLFSH